MQQSERDRLIFFCILCLLVALNVAYYCQYISWALLPENGRALGTDFYVMWNTITHLGQRDYEQIYSTVIIDEYLTTGITPDFIGPFPYPPTMLLFLEPFTHLSRNAAYIVWTGAGFAGFLLLLLTARARECAAWLVQNPPYYAFAVLAVMGSALSVAALITGQTGFFAGILLLTGLLYRKTNPLLAGVALGLLTVKPQLGLLVPVLLIAQGQWRTFFLAMFTALILAVACILIYGVDAWQAYFHMTERFSRLFTDTPPPVYQISASFYLGLKMLGIPSAYAAVAQGVVTVLCGVFVWVLSRNKPLPESLCLTLFILANCVASPYSMSYDLMPVAFALMLLMQRALRDGFLQGERLVLGLALFAPLFVIALQPRGVPVMAAMLVMLLGYYGVVLRRV